MVEQRPEGAVGDHERAHGRRGRDGGVPRRLRDQRDLAEEVAGPDRGDLLAAALHLRRAVDQDEELAARVALPDQDLAIGQVDLVGDLGLVKLCAALWGRWVETYETAELLAPYEEWAGLAGLYLMRGWSAGLVPGANADLARLARCRAA